MPDKKQKNNQKNGEVVFHTGLVKIKIGPENAEKILKQALKILKGSLSEPGKECGYCKWIKEYSKQ